MKKLSRIRFVILIIAVFGTAHLNALTNDNKTRKIAATKVKIAAAQFLRLAYLGSGLCHLAEASSCALRHFNDQSSVQTLLKRIALGMMTELCGAYASFFSLMALSNYIKKLKGFKAKSGDLDDIPAEFAQENDEDIDRAIVDILLHSAVVLSAVILSYRTGCDYIKAYEVRQKMAKQELLPPAESSDLIIWSPYDTLTLLTGPVLLPGRLYTAYTSAKTIFSKITNVIKGYKRELPKCRLSNSNNFSRKQD